MSRLRSFMAAGLSIFALVASFGVASAHAQYQSSSPSANATVQAVPSTVQVTWTQELASIQFTITGPDGSNVVNGAAQIDLAQRHNGSVPVRDAGPAPVCIDNGQITPGQADFRVNTYCKRQMIRAQYKGKISELVFNYDLSIGMGLENSLKDAMAGGG